MFLITEIYHNEDYTCYGTFSNLGYGFKAFSNKSAIDSV